MQRKRSVFVSWLALAASCGGAQHASEAPPPATAEVTLPAGTVRPDGAGPSASSAPSSASPSPAPSDALQAAALRALDARVAAIAHCYATTLRQSPDATGQLAVDVAFNSAGHVDRASARIEGEGGIGSARVCVEDALRGATLENPPQAGVHVHRNYTFENPPVDLAVTAPFELHAPRHATHGAAVASPAPTSTSEPPEGYAGPLGASEVVDALGSHRTELEHCSEPAHGAHAVEGSATLHVTVDGHGQPTAASLSSDTPAITALGGCIETAVRAIRFRTSGTSANVTVPLAFQR